MNKETWTALYENISEIHKCYVHITSKLEIFTSMPDYLDEFYNLRQETQDLNPEFVRCDHPDYPVDTLVDKTTTLIDKYKDLLSQIEESHNLGDSHIITDDPERDIIAALEAYFYKCHFTAEAIVYEPIYVLSLNEDQTHHYYSNYVKLYNIATSRAGSHHVVLPNPRCYSTRNLMYKVHEVLTKPVLETDNFVIAYQKYVLDDNARIARSRIARELRNDDTTDTAVE